MRENDDLRKSIFPKIFRSYVKENDDLRKSIFPKNETDDEMREMRKQRFEKKYFSEK